MSKTRTTAAQASTTAKADTTAQPGASAPAEGTNQAANTGAASQQNQEAKDAHATSQARDSDGAGSGASNGSATGLAGDAGADGSATDGAPALATGGAADADQALGGDGLQAPATAARAFHVPDTAPGTVEDMLAFLRGLDEEALAEAARVNSRMSAALDRLQAERQVGGQPAAASEGLKRAVITFAGVVHSAQVGDLVEGTEQQLRGLIKSGDLDDHPDTLAAAEAKGVKVHRLNG